MMIDLARRWVLIAATESEAETLRRPFAQGLLAGWETVTADSFERARLILQHQPCDVVLVDEGLFRRENGRGLAWLALQRDVPVLLMTQPDPDAITAALERGVKQWLPRDLALERPAMLAAALRQAAEWTELRWRARRTGDALDDCRRQVSRFVDLLWESASIDPHTRWFTQRHMMDRLQEEIARSSRYGTRFSLALGDVQRQPAGGDGASVPVWAAERIARTKRRCDAVGHYGPHGFLLLLVHANEQGAAACCRRILQGLIPPSSVTDSNKPVEICFGVTACPPGGSSIKSLLGDAEQRLEQACVQGGGAIAC